MEGISDKTSSTELMTTLTTLTGLSAAMDENEQQIWS